MARAKKGATSKGKGGGRSPAPTWLWLVTGLAVGLFIAFLVFLGTHGKPGASTPAAAKETPAKPEKKPEPQAAKETKPATGQQADKTEPAKPAKPPEKKPMDYSFYKTLPKFEVKVPPAKNDTAPKRPDQPAPVTLQVGAFKSANEADARKAQLALLGIVSSVQAVNADGKPSYHRVRVGPLRDPRLAEVRQTLRENNIDFSIAPP